MSEKLDIEPGTEWLLPAARRWLAQAKSTMRTPLGMKVFPLPSGETVTVNWRQGVDYIRLAVGPRGAVFTWVYFNVGTARIKYGGRDEIHATPVMPNYAYLAGSSIDGLVVSINTGTPTTGFRVAVWRRIRV